MFEQIAELLRVFGANQEVSTLYLVVASKIEITLRCDFILFGKAHEMTVFACT